MMKTILSALIAFGLGIGGAVAQDLPTVRLGLLQFGTVNWEAQTILSNGLDRKHGFTLEVVPFASGDATDVALQAGAIDVSTSDWLWASRQRGDGSPMTYVPFSSSIGAVMVPCDAGYDSLDDLKGKTIGVAGGPLDKSWLMLIGYAQGELGFDLAGETSQVFGAPPLLAEKAKSKELDAVLNYWHINARLETEGFCQLVSAQDAARALGASGDISAVGYIFSDTWADANPELAKGFVAASREAKEILATSDAAWEKIRDLTKAENDAVFAKLKERWRQGVPTRPIADEERDTAAVYAFLAKAGGEKLVGKATEMAPGTFWPGLKSGS
jgi:NitT/TauT family transport system substrate-binding protein